MGDPSHLSNLTSLFVKWIQSAHMTETLAQRMECSLCSRAIFMAYVFVSTHCSGMFVIKFPRHGSLLQLEMGVVPFFYHKCIMAYLGP